MRVPAAVPVGLVRVPCGTRNFFLWDVLHDPPIGFVAKVQSLASLEVSGMAGTRSWSKSLTDAIDVFCAYVAAVSGFSLIHAVSTDGSSTKCFLPTI